MTVRRFQLSTRRTGRFRIVKVRVYDTTLEMQTAAERFGRYPTGHLSTAGAVTISRRDWDDRDPRPYQAMIFLARDQLDLTTVAHEAMHAAAHLYSIDCYRDNSRASAHLRIDNEPLAYLASDIFSRIVWKFDIIPIGDVAPAEAEHQ